MSRAWLAVCCAAVLIVLGMAGMAEWGMLPAAAFFPSGTSAAPPSPPPAPTGAALAADPAPKGIVRIAGQRTAAAAASPAAPAAAAIPAAPAPQAPVGALVELEPVLHAQRARILTCMDKIVSESAAVIDTAHTAISSWNDAAPNDNEFLSIVGLSYANKAAPNAAAIIVAAPVGPGKCDGATVQIFPVARACSALQSALIKDGRTVAMLRGLPVIDTQRGFRDVLIPGAGGGCVVVAVGLRQ